MLLAFVLVSRSNYEVQPGRGATRAGRCHREARGAQGEPSPGDTMLGGRMDGTSLPGVRLRDPRLKSPPWGLSPWGEAVIRLGSLGVLGGLRVAPGSAPHRPFPPADPLRRAPLGADITISLFIHLFIHL